MTGRKNSFARRNPRYSQRLQVDFELLAEPVLLFRQNVPNVSAKRGLSSVGPISRDFQTHPREILVAVVGSGETTDLTSNWIELCKSSIASPPAKDRQHPEFPGFNISSTFDSELKVHASWQGKVTNTEISSILQCPDKALGFQRAVETFNEKLKNLCQGESPPDVIICAIPDEIVDYCAEASAEFLEESRQPPRTPMERLFKRMARIEMATGQMHLTRMLFGEAEKSPDFVGRNLRRALKAAAMPLGRPLQIATSKLFRHSADAQDPATKAWNLCVALYYKAGGVPWRLERFSRDTCFVGISFFRNLADPSLTVHTSVAQVFTGEGDAIVLRGRKFEWKHKWEKSPHLGMDDAANLMRLALSEYKKSTGVTPRRVVVHKTSAYWPDERSGFVDGLVSESVREHDLVNLQQLGMRFFREGKYPPLRGTYCRLNSVKHVLYTLGYIPYLGTYPRPYVPEPWELSSHFGDTSPRHLLEEVLSLTKMNFNNAEGADNEPITIRFARKVGEILSYVAEDDPIQPSYRFYM